MRLPIYLLSALALLIPLAQAKSDTISTESVAYCSEEEQQAIFIQRFDLKYHRKNESISFDISAATTSDELRLAASVVLNVYGMSPVNVSVDLCSVASGALCPLPKYNFTTMYSLPVPEIASKIPEIAWYVPDLEAVARVELYNSGTNDMVGCVQTRLTNGLSMYQRAVSLGTALVTLAILLASVIHSARSPNANPSQWRILDVLGHFQHMAASTLLNLNYPWAYIAFGRNFAWALGLIRWGGLLDMADSFRRRTGGTISGREDTSESASTYTSRRLSPYNLGNKPAPSSGGASPSLFNSLGKREIPTVSDDPGQQIGAGIPTYVSQTGIPQENALTTVFFIALCLFAIYLAATLLIGALVFFLGRNPDSAMGRFRARYRSFVVANWLRLYIAMLFPVLTFTFYQWTIGTSDSWVPIVLSILLLLLTALPLLLSYTQVVRLARRSAFPRDAYFDDERSIGRSGLWALYQPFKRPTTARFVHPVHFGILANALAIVARAGFIGFGQSNTHGAQVIGLLVIEVLLFVAMLVVRPYRNNKAEVLMAFLGFIRILTWAVEITFVESVGIDAIPRAVIGIVLAVILAATTVILWLDSFYNLLTGLFFRRHPKMPVQLTTYPDVYPDPAPRDDEVNRSRDSEAPTLTNAPGAEYSPSREKSAGSEKRASPPLPSPPSSSADSHSYAPSPIYPPAPQRSPNAFHLPTGAAPPGQGRGQTPYYSALARQEEAGDYWSHPHAQQRQSVYGVAQ